jgi:hypothetical protein
MSKVRGADDCIGTISGQRKGQERDRLQRDAVLALLHRPHDHAANAQESKSTRVSQQNFKQMPKDWKRKVIGTKFRSGYRKDFVGHMIQPEIDGLPLRFCRSECPTVVMPVAAGICCLNVVVSRHCYLGDACGEKPLRLASYTLTWGTSR